MDLDVEQLADQAKIDRAKAFEHVAKIVIDRGHLETNSLRLVEKYLPQWFRDFRDAQKSLHDVKVLTERLRENDKQISLITNQNRGLQAALAAKIEAHIKDSSHLDSISTLMKQFDEWGKDCSIDSTRKWQRELNAMPRPPEPPGSMVHWLCGLFCSEHIDMVETHQTLIKREKELRTESANNAKFLAEKFSTQRALILALKFYADEESYKPDPKYIPGIAGAKIYRDNGKLARDTLNPKEE